MAEPLDQQERLALCELLTELGPDAPTLCEGWTTLDLAAHLVLREHFSSWDDRRMAVEKAKGLPALVERLRHDVPPVPWKVPVLRTIVNGVEYFIHHEDVRRANGLAPRPPSRPLEELAWRSLALIGRGAARKARPLSVTLVADDGRTKTFGSGEGVTLTGPPTELLLHLSGRQEAAVVAVDGPPEAVAAFTEATR